VGDISYTPEFRHIDWVDDVDRIRAGEPNGFNSRLQAIERDLQQLSTVVAQIDTALDQLDAIPPPTPTRLVVPPSLLALSGNHNWAVTASGAVQATPGRQPIGEANLILPDGVQLSSFRAAGQSDGVSQFGVGLVRIPYDAPTAARDLAVVPADTSTYDKTLTIDPAVARVDTATFRYVIVATCLPTPSDRVRATVAVLHVVYLADRTTIS
jgi:hypothetical protein